MKPSQELYQLIHTVKKKRLFSCIPKNKKQNHDSPALYMVEPKGWSAFITHDIWQYLTEDISKYSIMEYLTRNSNIYDCIMFNIFVDESLTNV